MKLSILLSVTGDGVVNDAWMIKEKVEG